MKLAEFEDKNNFALALAARDAKDLGVGFIIVTPDGGLTYVDAEEVMDIAKQVTNETK